MNSQKMKQDRNEHDTKHSYKDDRALPASYQVHTHTNSGAI